MRVYELLDTPAHALRYSLDVAGGTNGTHAAMELSITSLTSA